MDLSGIVWDQDRQIDFDKARHLPDMHIHTLYCNHASNTLLEVVRHLRDNALFGAINEHATPPEEFVRKRGIYLSKDHLTGPSNEDRLKFFRHCSMSPTDIFGLLTDLHNINFESGPNYTIPIGLEVDIIPGMEDQTGAIIGDYKDIFDRLHVPLNHISGSYHYINDYSSFQDGFAELLMHNNNEKIVRDYFETLCNAVESKRYDFICHPGLIHFAFNRLGILMMEDAKLRGAFQKGYSELLDVAARSKTALEINTSGIMRDNYLRDIPREEWKDHPLDCPNPHMPISIIQEGLDRGVKFVVGSDWHKDKNQLGMPEYQQYFDQVYDVLKTLGANEVCMVLNRNLVSVPLE